MARLMRVMVAPGKWVDEGPAYAARQGRHNGRPIAEVAQTPKNGSDYARESKERKRIAREAMK